MYLRFTILSHWFLENESHFTVVDVYCAERLRKWNFSHRSTLLCLLPQHTHVREFFVGSSRIFTFFYSRPFSNSLAERCVWEGNCSNSISVFFYFSISLLLFFLKRLHTWPEDYCTSNDHTNEISPIKKSISNEPQLSLILKSQVKMHSLYGL